MPTSRPPTSRTSTSARNEIITMLKDDHKRVKKAFSDFEKIDPAQDAEQCQQIVRHTCNELTLHATLEEELLYPAARQALPDADLVNEAEVEHASAKDLIEQLKGMTPDDEKYCATFKVLGEYIKHHVKEEENEMFPELSKVKLDWDSLCAEMNARRAELTAELMPEQAEADDDVAESVEPTTSASRDTRRPNPAQQHGSTRARVTRSGETRAQAAARSDDAEGSDDPRDGD